MPNKAFVYLSLLLALGLQAKTNVVVFLTDDQGWGDLSLMEIPTCRPPILIRLGKMGRLLIASLFVQFVRPRGLSFLQVDIMSAVGYTVHPQVESAWTWMRQQLRTFSKKRDMLRVHSVNGTMVCSILTILLAEGLIISTDSVPGIGGITTML